jgi:hypothetical protein
LNGPPNLFFQMQKVGEDSPASEAVLYTQ